LPDEPEGPKGVPNRKGRYEGPDGELAAILERDVLETSPGVRWEHIAGLTDAKRLLEEVVVLPLWMPEYFQVQFVLIMYCYFALYIYIYNMCTQEKIGLESGSSKIVPATSLDSLNIYTCILLKNKGCA
jgi:hypothetical protein